MTSRSGGQTITGGGLLTTVVVEAELFEGLGSIVVDEIVAVLLITTPLGSAQSTPASIMKLALSLTAIVSFLQVIVPPEPSGGVTQLQPAAPEKDCSRVPAGKVSCHCAKAAGPEPLLLTLIV